MAVTDDPQKPDPPLLRRIDLAAFSQSELRTLCAISNARLKISNSDDIVIPQINTAVFNECASARKQTYSPRKCGSGVAGPRRRFSSHVAPSESDDGSLRESRLIVGFFKQYMQNRGKNVEIPETRKRPAENRDGGSGVQIVNRNGVSVDLRKLEAIIDPYGGELRRRTAGMETEEELLGFLKSLEGKWCSTRKKRRIVDASLLGDALPVGWKIVIALKRKAGRFSPFCRRYISPTGEHLPSCKEVAAYLSSYLASSDMNLSGEALVESQGVVSEKDAGTNPVGLCSTQDISNSTKHPPSLPVVYEDAAVSGVDNVSDAQVRGFFECYKCKLKFSEKDAYVKHLLSSHENAPKRYRMGSPIGKGVIFKDGKYECQFCHKVFLDKKRYTCHVGVHVRNFNRGSEQLFDIEAIKCTEQSSVDKMPSELSKMDALLAIAESSAEALPGSVSKKVSDADSLVARRNSAIDSPKLEMETTGKTAKNVIEVPSPVGEIRQILVGDKEMGIDDHQSIVYSDKISIAPFNEEIHNALAKVIPFEVSALQHQGAKSICDLNSWTDPASTCTTHEKRVDSLESFVTGFNKASASFTDVGSAPSSTSTMPQKFRSIRASPKSGGSSGDSHSNIISASIAPQMSINTAPETRKGGENTSDTLMLEEPVSGARNLIMTVCVWCGTSFFPEVAVLEAESDSVGYMCTSCRTKISKQISELERSWGKTSPFL